MLQNISGTSIAMAEQNIYSAFVQSAQKHGDRVAVVGDGGRGISYTYSELLSRVNALAAGLRKLSGGPDSSVGLLSENRPEWPLAYFAILAANKTVVPIDANLTHDEIESLVRSAGLSHLIASGKFAALRESLGDQTKMHFIDSGCEDDWKDLFCDGSELRPDPDNQLAALIFTSGTTGSPKGVMLTHRNLLSNVQGAKEALQFSEEDVFLSLLPLHHTFEATCGFLVPLFDGARIVYARSLKSRDIVEDIKSNSVTIMIAVPLLFEKMNQGISRSIGSAGMARRFLFSFLMSLSAFGWRLGQNWGRDLFSGLRKQAGMSSIRMFVSGGAALPPAIGRFFNLLGFQLIQGYGMTECSPIISANRPDDIRFDSVGPPLPNVEVKINQPNNEGIGEIITRGANITPGYKGNQEATAQLIREGWLFTGDLGRISRGHLYITGRAKNLIVSAAGKNIYPEELEERLSRFDGVLESVVFGRQKEGRQGEEVRAVIVADLDYFGLSENGGIETGEMDHMRGRIDEAVAELNKSMASYKRIVGYEMRTDELEKTSSRKIKRFLYR